MGQKFFLEFASGPSKTASIQDNEIVHQLKKLEKTEPWLLHAREKLIFL